MACDDGSAYDKRRRGPHDKAPAESATPSAGGGWAVPVERAGVEAALARHAPRVVVVSWHPSGLDWSCLFRESACVDAYVLLGEADSSTCGDGWATWGQLPPNAEEYGLDESSPAPHAADGWRRVACGEVSAHQICRFDSSAARGFSSCVAFVRGGAAEGHEEPASRSASDEPASGSASEGETLEESWERMQRSLAAGRAQRVAVEMDMRRVPEDRAPQHQ